MFKYGCFDYSNINLQHRNKHVLFKNTVRNTIANFPQRNSKEQCLLLILYDPEN